MVVVLGSSTHLFRLAESEIRSRRVGRYGLRGRLDSLEIHVEWKCWDRVAEIGMDWYTGARFDNVGGLHLHPGMILWIQLMMSNEIDAYSLE